MQRVACLFAVLSLAVWSGLSVIVYDVTCMNHVPRRFTQEEQRELCAEQPQSLAPAACAHAMIRGNENKKTAIRLCRNAFSTAAVHCFRAAGAYSTLDTRIALCSRSNTTYPAACWKAVSVMSQVKPAQRLHICQGVQTAPELECVEAALSAFPNTDAWLQCVEPGVGELQPGVGRCILEAAELRLMNPRQSVSSCRVGAASHLCLQQLQQEGRRWKLAPEVCFGAPHDEPVACAVQALSLQPRIPASVIGQLCRNAGPATAGGIHAPLECFQRLPNTLSKELRADVCAGARSSAPADCFRAANMLPDAETRVQFCQYASDSSKLQCLSSCTRLVRGTASTNSTARLGCAAFCNDADAADRTTCLATISRISVPSDQRKDFHHKFLELCEAAGDEIAVAAMVRVLAVRGVHNRSTRTHSSDLLFQILSRRCNASKMREGRSAMQTRLISAGSLGNRHTRQIV
jgi:hypothetical protein